ncbi:hypothetical protein H2200_008447 [Cladophialophora chaetospira]|uniref:Uncharacterized protein n=1 Tax=Cladophialophora chaetospira TaxID=386627 RepID=A0AA39CG42_9EURO|nr:hypothetical protein H2200_008447 [Cladophialophora chaetospira]
MGVQYRLDVTMLPDRKPKTRQIVAAVYNQCKRGMREPDDSFLRTPSTYYNTPWDGQDIPSVWNLDQLPAREEALYVLLSFEEAARDMVTRFCIYVMDDIPAPQAFHLSFESLSTFLMIQGKHYRSNSRSATGWNVELVTENIQPDSDWYKNLRTEVSDAIVRRRGQSESGSYMSPRRSPYHNTREIPPHLRSSRKVPKGHWVITSDPDNTYEDFRTATDLLVARRHSAKLITCLFAEPKTPGRAGFSFEQTPGTKKLSPEQRERKIAELQGRWKQGWEPGAEDFPEVGNIIQRGDYLNLPGPFLQRQRDGIVRGVLQGDELGAGDWFSDQELVESYWLADADGNVVLGRAGKGTTGSKDLGKRNSRKRTREEDSGNAPDRHSRHSQKRVRFEEPPAASDESAHRLETQETITERDEEVILLGGHVTDEELNELLEAGYFRET